MRIFHVTAYFAPAFVYGGPPKSIHGLCRALRRTGVDVEVFTTDANGDGVLPHEVTASREHDGVPVRYFPRSWPPHPIGSTALTAALRAALPKADLVHIHGLWNRVVWAAAREARRARAPYVLSPRGMLEDAALAHRPWRKRVAYTLIERRTIAGAALLHATSEREAETLRSAYPGSPVVLVPNGIDPPVIGGLTRDRNAGRARLGLAVDAPIVLFLGRVHPIKRLDLLIDAFALVRARHPRSHLVIAGPDEAGLRPSLESRAGAAAASMTWTGVVNASQKEALLAAADALVLCSDSESFGISAAEAMGAGVPVVVTRTCPWQDVERHAAGFWVEQRADAIAHALSRLFDDPGAAKPMGERGRALVHLKYQWDTVAETMATHYRTASKASPRTSERSEPRTRERSEPRTRERSEPRTASEASPAPRAKRA